MPPGAPRRQACPFERQAALALPFETLLLVDIDLAVTRATEIKIKKNAIEKMILQMMNRAIFFRSYPLISFILAAILVNICALNILSGQVQAADYRGPYLGGAIGTAYNFIKAKKDDDKKSINTQEGFLSYWGGYGVVKDNIYYGIEMDFFINDTKDSDSISEQYSPIIRAGLIQPDIFYDELLLYSLIGWQAADVRHENNSDVFYGPRLGAGFEYQIQERIYNNQKKSKIFFRGELNYVHYSQKDLSNTSSDTTLSPRSMYIQMGLGFRF